MGLDTFQNNQLNGYLHSLEKGEKNEEEAEIAVAEMLGKTTDDGTVAQSLAEIITSVCENYNMETKAVREMLIEAIEEEI